jgi:hypothetical protein
MHKDKRPVKKLQTAMYWTILASETSHVFCCVLPTLFSILSLLANLGVVATMPGWLENVHGALHHWEVPLIAMSGLVVILGWALYLHSRRVDCHDTGCHHGNCTPRKNTASAILKIATVLFIANTLIYMVFHRGMTPDVTTEGAMHAGHEH